MRVGRAFLYTVLAVAAAVAYGVGVGPYWVIDLAVFAVVAGAVGFFSFARRAKTESMYWMLRMGTKLGRQYAEEADHRARTLDQIEHVTRSRIAHYITVSRTKSTRLTAWLRRESDSPFERTLFSEPKWRTLSGEKLEEVSRKALDAPAKSAR